MVDKSVLAAKVASVRDAVERIRAVLPETAAAFEADRTAREVVVLNLFVALQDCLVLATHWLADAGSEVPQSYRDLFESLARRSVIPRDLAARLAAASGFRNLIAHQYGAVDPARVYQIARSDLGDLLEFCAEIARRADAQG
jgi:uncharacterized protein YutE (UPF0331/DUF86 family)